MTMTGPADEHTANLQTVAATTKRPGSTGGFQDNALPDTAMGQSDALREARCRLRVCGMHPAHRYSEAGEDLLCPGT